MAGSDEDDRGSVLLSEEEEEEEDLEVGMDGAGGRAVDADASEEWTTAAKGREKAKRRQSHIQQAAELDATCEEDAYEEGLLMPRTLAELTSQDSPVLWVGQELSCRAELSLRVAEDCEAQQRFYTANNGQKKGYAYSNKMLGRVIQPAVLRAGRHSLSHMKELKLLLGSYVNMKIKSHTASRLRNDCVKLMYGEVAEGAQLVPALVHEMMEKGYYAKIHYADADRMIKLTLNSML